MAQSSAKHFSEFLAELVDSSPRSDFFEGRRNAFGCVVFENASPSNDRVQALDSALAWTEACMTVDGVASNTPMGPALETILAELGPLERLMPSQLRDLRRRFLWKYHPDRHPEAAREAAGRRVATANMLIDAALSAYRLQT